MSGQISNLWDDQTGVQFSLSQPIGRAAIAENESDTTPEKIF